MNDELLNAFDDCLNALAAGETVAACLARYPALANDLRPMLEAAHLAATARPRAEAALRSAQNVNRAAFLSRAAALRAQRPHSFWAAFAAPRRAWAPALALLLFVCLGSYGALQVSADSLPGDALYSLKRAAEQTQLTFTLDPQARLEFEQELDERRAAEAQAVTTQGRAVAVEFNGLVTEMTDTRLTVAGLAVRLTIATRLTGVPALGAWVSVSGQTQADGSVTAETVTVVSEEFMGVVNAIGADQWQIDEARVLVNPQTEVKGQPRVGDTVRVKARSLADGQRLALEIERLNGQPPTATAQPSATTAPSVTPAPSNTSAPTETEANHTPEPSHTPKPSNTPRPTSTGSGGGGGPSPSNTPKPTSTSGGGGGGGGGPSPSNTPKPSQTPEPTRTPEPTHTPQPSHTPEPSPTPALTPTETATPQEFEVEGLVQAINGNEWLIDGTTVIVTAETVFEDNPQVGDVADAHGYIAADGRWIATRIKKK